MTENFQPAGRPTLIGSLPMNDHLEALKLVLKYTPEIPLWVQLPIYREEGMMVQFLPGFPGLEQNSDKTFINSDSENFETDLLGFYEDYLAVDSGEKDLSDSRFSLTRDTAAGFFEFFHTIKSMEQQPFAVKAQITGPITLGTGLKDQDGRAVFYDERLRDAAVKLIAMKARWQVKKLKSLGRPVIVFFDEPGLTGFGSSAFISISREEISECFREVIEAVHAEGGLAGIHVCANAEWSLILDSPADIVSFDAYSFFDKFLLYKQQIIDFTARNGIFAWGIVPTSSPEDLRKETVDSLMERFEGQVAAMEKIGLKKEDILAQTLITPSCGTGSLELKYAVRVLELTAELSKKIRAQTIRKFIQ